MPKRKMQRFAELNTFENVIQPKSEDTIDGNHKFKGKWASEFFKNSHPVILELACGKGEYTIGLAEKFPEINFIGIDIKGERIWKGSSMAIEKGLKNVAFLRSRIEFINLFFDKDEISEIWITFPDPQPKKPNIKKRLTSPQFIERYKEILKPEGIIHLKTDNTGFFNYTLEMIEDGQHELLLKTHDLYTMENIDNILSIKTYYEQIFSKQGYNICYLRFRINTSS
jgi:tRNA (guanine-N7-)-methyltransferase